MGCRGWWPRRAREEATVEEHFVWMTTRQLKPGTLAEFERAWRPDTHPEGMLRAYAYWSADGREIIGVSFWASQELCEAWRSSAAAGRRWPARGCPGGLPLRPVAGPGRLSTRWAVTARRRRRGSPDAVRARHL